MAKSEYLQREEAAKKQLGAKGVKKRVKQVPRAARLSVKELTGVNISRKGVSVDPIGLAMAVSPFKLLKASRALRAAGMARPYSVANRVAKEGLADQFFDRAMTKLGGRNVSKEIAKRNAAGRSTELPMAAAKGMKVSREASESVFPRASTGTLESISNLNPETARRVARSFGQAASRERGLARSLRNVPGERNRSMNLFRDSLVNQRAGKAVSKYKTPKRGR